MGSPLTSKHVFFSYSHHDAQIMNQIRNELERTGIRVWTDEGLTPGTESWKTTIESKIRDAIGIVVILSPSANESLWVERELEYANVHKIKVFPVLVQGEPADAVPIELINAQWLDIRNEAGFAAQVQKLVLALEEESARSKDLPEHQRSGHPSTTTTKSNGGLATLPAVIVGACLICAAMITILFGSKVMGYLGGDNVTPTNLVSTSTSQAETGLPIASSTETLTAATTLLIDMSTSTFLPTDASTSFQNLALPDLIICRVDATASTITICNLGIKAVLLKDLSMCYRPPDYAPKPGYGMCGDVCGIVYCDDPLIMIPPNGTFVIDWREFGEGSEYMLYYRQEESDTSNNCVDAYAHIIPCRSSE